MADSTVGGGASAICLMLPRSGGCGLAFPSRRQFGHAALAYLRRLTAWRALIWLMACIIGSLRPTVRSRSSS
ncbi:hypothetical protein QBC33DRAFT_536883 [Phialemonium atrogriseum]|uniref:Uncharacterized protein n=1 Tax=Phialemonium atrogriseum TaxID=1093897 RepID=A0AAJ0FNZ3_9PEZI|nr:uncharacterized protein QBC33DRAFT_536883 [Phialemonium atrogriseum]KAK1767655.1 hypothetical protein QBC33DRAFT_536883 [Phialemonium atrogriseum]